jgi:hypothetical protein
VDDVPTDDGMIKILGSGGLATNGVVGQRVSKGNCDGLPAIVDYHGWSRTLRRRQVDIKREKAKQPGSSFEFPGRRLFTVLNYAATRFADCRKASRGRSSGSARWTRIESIYRSVGSRLGQRILSICSPLSSPTSRGFCALKRRRFNDLGEMTACLQSRCSPS